MGKKAISNTFTVNTVEKGDKGDDAKYIYIRGTGYNNQAERILNITSTTNIFSEYQRRGFAVARINRYTLAVSGITWFDVYGGTSEGSGAESAANANTARTRFVTYLANTTSDYFIAVASYDAIGLDDAMVAKMREFGLGELDCTAVSGVGGFRTPFAFLGYKGLQQGYALYQLHGEGENEPYAEVMAYVSNGIFMSSKDGKDGARGKVGRFFYFGGTFDSSDSDPTHTFVVNDSQAPYFEHTENGQKRYHVFNYETNGSYTMAQMWAISNNWNNKPWEVMTNDFKYIITEALFGAYAHLGSFIINEDWMLSQYGELVQPSGNIITVNASNVNTKYSDNSPVVLNGNHTDNGIIVYKVSFNVSSSTTINITLTTSSENNYDFGAVGKVDNDSLLSATASSIKSDTGSVTLLKISGSSASSTISTISTSISLNAGSHYLYIGYFKDGSSYAGNDNASFDISGATYNLTEAKKTSGMSMSGGPMSVVPYGWFDHTDPEVKTLPTSGYKFRPAFAVDGLTGETYQQSAHIKGTVTATSGTFSGSLDSASGTFTGSVISNNNNVLLTKTENAFGLHYTWAGFAATSTGNINGDLATIGARLNDNGYDYGRIALIKRNTVSSVADTNTPIIMSAKDGSIEAAAYRIKHWDSWESGDKTLDNKEANRRLQLLIYTGKDVNGRLYLNTEPERGTVLMVKRQHGSGWLIIYNNVGEEIGNMSEGGVMMCVYDGYKWL